MVGDTVNDVYPLRALVLIPLPDVSQTFLLSDPLWLRKISTDRHIVTHLNSFGVFILHSVGTYSLISTFGNYNSRYMFTKMQEFLLENEWQLDCGLKLCMCGGYTAE